MKRNLDRYALDAFTDKNFEQTLVKVAHNLPRDVRNEGVPSPSDLSGLEDDQFALSVITKTAEKINRFPINNKLNTALANEYFELNGYKLSYEAQKVAAVQIKKACNKFGLEPHNSIKVASMNHDSKTNVYFEKDASKATSSYVHPKVSKHYYALGTKYAMPTKPFLDMAVDYFHKFAKELPPQDRHTFAVNVFERAKELGETIKSAAIEKYAGTHYNPELEQHLKLRERLLDEASPYVPALRKLASYKSTTEPITFAKVLQEFDKKAGLDTHYDTYISDPYASTFGKKMSKIAGYVYEQDGIYLTEADIEKVAKNQYATLKDYFGHTLADGLKKEGASAFMALPDDAKDIIARIANGELK